MFEVGLYNIASHQTTCCMPTPFFSDTVKCIAHGRTTRRIRYKYRIYPWPVGAMTCYIRRERSVLEWSRGSAARGTSRLDKSTDLSRGIEWFISPAGQGYVHLIRCLGYSVQSLRSNGMRLVHVAGYTTHYLTQLQQSDWPEKPKYSISSSISRANLRGGYVLPSFPDHDRLSSAYTVQVQITHAIIFSKCGTPRFHKATAVD